MAVMAVLRVLFLSTPSARRATDKDYPKRVAYYISIHALREEGDTVSQALVWCSVVFLSTPSARRATCGRPVPSPPR